MEKKSAMMVNSDSQSAIARFPFYLLCFSLLGISISIGVTQIRGSIWYAGYDVKNCLGCKAKVNWADEKTKISANTKEFQEYHNKFKQDGVILLSDMFSIEKVNELGKEADELPETFMTNILARFFLKQYRKYEHRLDTRSELIRDWAIHSPLGTIASILLNTTQVRLYNAEIIYHQGEGEFCKPAWHRDTIAAPFEPTSKSITFNVYLDDISGESDSLVYLQGSQKTKSYDMKTLFEPNIKVGDLLAHDPNVYHTPSGKGCWKRRSLQFRYVEGISGETGDNTIFSFGSNRIPHGLMPWTFAHSPGIAPHDLISNVSSLQGPWYPQVFPTVLQEEHVPLQNYKPWSFSSILNLIKEAENIVYSEADDMPVKGSFAMEGLVQNRDDWFLGEFVPGVKVPCLKDGLFCKKL